MYPNKKEWLGMLACFLILALIIICSQGCAANCNTVMGKPAIWKSYEHMKCSIVKFDEDCAKTEIKQARWWGCETEVKK
jgi:hypothetical protein